MASFTVPEACQELESEISLLISELTSTDKSNDAVSSSLFQIRNLLSILEESTRF